MTMDWYGFVVWGDDAICQKGLLGIGGLFYQKEGVTFFLDLAGHVQQYCVIGMKCGDEEEQDYPFILRSLPRCRAKMADSFTGWLEQPTATNGKVGYIS